MNPFAITYVYLLFRFLIIDQIIFDFFFFRVVFDESIPSTSLLSKLRYLADQNINSRARLNPLPFLIKRVFALIIGKQIVITPSCNFKINLFIRGVWRISHDHFSIKTLLGCHRSKSFLISPSLNFKINLFICRLWMISHDHF